MKLFFIEHINNMKIIYKDKTAVRWMGKGLFASLAILLAGTANAAQLSPDLRQLDRVPLAVAAVPIIDKALLEATPRKDRPYTFAVPTSVDLRQGDGVWSDVSPGLVHWRARIAAPGATMLHFRLNHVALPNNAELWVYDSGGKTVQGPYTSADILGGELRTADIVGDVGIVEVRMASNDKPKFTINVADVRYGIRKSLKFGVFPQSGSCEVDVACSQGDQYRSEIRSVAMLTYDTSTTSDECSGALVNDVPQDGQPYIFTARHCGITSSIAPELTVYWLDQKASCGSGSEDLSHPQQHATFVTNDSASDFTLIKMNSPPPSDANVYYSGWDVSDTPPQCGVGIHHPSADAKKISIYKQAATAQQVDTPAIQAWQVFWARGVTEQGSSGSGLWDSNHHIVGVLHGGGSDCTHQSEPDYYGRLGVAWSNNSALRNALDPNDTGAVHLCGRNPGDAVDPNCATTSVV
ncbi:MAG TPA: trypsin-like serine protease, partial [Nevskiaceae bacterium]|nr:trypsin-like serine protease [Nevskiaceae bacterium]